MQRLWKKYRPRTLSEVVGQPPVQFLQRVVANPYSGCWCLEGPPGVGKTAAAGDLSGGPKS